MRKWLAQILGKRTTATAEEAVTVVPDSKYQFKFGTKPMLPDGLRELKITELRRGLLILENYYIDLTVDQSYMDDTPERIAMASRCLRWSKTYHELEKNVRTPVRLHRDNAMIVSSHYSETKKPEADIKEWLAHFDWDVNRPFHVQQTTTCQPLEDGYFSCVRITCGKVHSGNPPELNWQDRSSISDDIGCLSTFVREEQARIEGNQSCEGFLRETYENIPDYDLTHPVFALLDYPVFDMGIVVMSFAGSVWSENELRFWSRPTYFHK